MVNSFMFNTSLLLYHCSALNKKVMAITNVGKNRVYASIKDLPENQSIVDGDKIIVDTDSGTCLIDYSNFKIDLSHTTFEQQFYDLSDLASSSSAFIEQVEE